MIREIIKNGNNFNRLKYLFNAVKHGVFELHSTGEPKFLKKHKIDIKYNVFWVFFWLHKIS